MSPQLFKIIATFIIIYLFFRIFTTWILPMIIRWYINRFKKRFYQQHPHASEAKEKRRKGNVHITYTKETGKTDTNSIGEYVDFEEVKDSDKKTEQQPHGKNK